MITPVKPRPRKSRIRRITEQFLTMLPLIQDQARHAFRNARPERREELTAEVVANCWVAFVRLIDRGLDDVIYPTPLAQYAIKQVRDGRRVGNKLNVNDVSSKHCQQRKGVKLDSLDVFDAADGEWKEAVVEDKTAGPADVAATRIDFAAWLKSLPRMKREIAKTLATGETTKKAARKHRVSPGRISQVRRELMEAWESFIGEDQESFHAALA
jgi:hypothetical protein